MSPRLTLFSQGRTAEAIEMVPLVPRRSIVNPTVWQFSVKANADLPTFDGVDCFSVLFHPCKGQTDIHILGTLPQMQCLLEG